MGNTLFAAQLRGQEWQISRLEEMDVWSHKQRTRKRGFVQALLDVPSCKSAVGIFVGMGMPFLHLMRPERQYEVTEEA